MNFDGFFCLFSNILGMPRPGFGHTNITTAAALGMLGNSGEMCVCVRERDDHSTPCIYLHISAHEICGIAFPHRDKMPISLICGT